MIDFSNSGKAEFMSIIGQARRMIDGQPPRSVYTLTLVENAHYDREVAEALREYVALNKPYVRAGAVVGLNDLKKIVFNFLNRVTGRALKAFEDVESARAWLATVE